MKEINTTFIEKINRVPGVDSFRFRPEQKIDFLPGQFLKILFDKEKKNNAELNKYLSFSSSPLKEYIEVTKRLSGSSFSGRLSALKAGDEVKIECPMGRCVLKNDYKKILFLIGGIGITPVISIIEYIVENNTGTDAILFYSNKTEEDIAFKPELDLWQSRNKNIKVFYTITDCPPKDNRCLSGYINDAMLKDKVKDLKERKIFIFGPPGMVKAMQNVCSNMVCPAENIITEAFHGY